MSFTEIAIQSKIDCGYLLLTTRYIEEGAYTLRLRMPAATYSRVVGLKRYELTDLGNVHAVVIDRRQWLGTDAVPEVYSIVDYYSFGSERNSSDSEGYRYGFNLQESTAVLKIIEEGQDSDENLNRWLDTSPTYKSYFPEDGNRMGQHISAEEGVKSYKGYKTFYKLKSKKTEE